jgi:uncharacterized membrane protein
MAEVETTRTGEIRYRRVRGFRSTLTLSHSALFTAPDHLLLCDYRSGFTERYKRFYFHDIEAVIIRKTQNWMASMAGWGIAGFGFFLIATATHWNRFLQVMEAICALFFLRNLIRGPSCRTHIQTAVQTDALPMLKRVRKTQRVLRSLFPLIEQSQSQRANAPGPAKVAIVPESPEAAAAVSQSAVPVRGLEEGAKRPHELSWLHVVTFVLVLFAGLNAIWEVNYSSSWSFIVLVTLFCVSTVCGVLALILQGKHRVHRGAAVMIWLLVLSFIIGGAGLEYAFSMVSFVRRPWSPRRRGQPPATFDFLSPFQMRAMPDFAAVLWVYGAWSILLGLVGLIFALMPPPAKSLPPPLPGEQRP